MLWWTDGDGEDEDEDEDGDDGDDGYNDDEERYSVLVLTPPLGDVIDVALVLSWTCPPVIHLTVVVVGVFWVCPLVI